MNQSNMNTMQNILHIQYGNDSIKSSISALDNVIDWTQPITKYVFRWILFKFIMLMYNSHSVDGIAFFFIHISYNIFWCGVQVPNGNSIFFFVYWFNNDIPSIEIQFYLLTVSSANTLNHSILSVNWITRRQTHCIHSQAKPHIFFI